MKFWLRIALSIVLVVLLFTYVVDAREVGRILQRFDAGYLLLAIAVVTIDRILMTFKWTLLLLAQGYRLPLLQGAVAEQAGHDGQRKDEACLPGHRCVSPPLVASSMTGRNRGRNVTEGTATCC